MASHPHGLEELTGVPANRVPAQATRTDRIESKAATCRTYRAEMSAYSAKLVREGWEATALDAG
jgi:hypothetical protein